MEDENGYAFFGTGLEPLDKDEAEVRKKPIRIEDQIATDDQGRRRFHGAFTGGFSAGFFNTAGSRDGWAPKSFKSSRNSKIETVRTQKPEDFMDQEDFGQFGIAPQGLKTNNIFTSSESNRKIREDERLPFREGTPVLTRLFSPITETIGVTLLKRMGWKDGQGIGPKLCRSRRRKIRRSNYLITQDNDDDDDDDNDDDKYKDFLFAPDDVPNFVAKPKSNSFGIGYKGLRGHINLFEQNDPSLRLQTDKRRKVSIRGQAFGIGVYEDDDDDDVYGRENMNRYDYSLSILSSTPEKRKKSSRWNTVNDDEKEISVDNFVKAKKSAKFSRIVFEAPEIPRNFQPRRIRKSRFDSNQSTDTILNPTPIERARALDENEPSPPPPPPSKPPPPPSEDEIRSLLSSYRSNNQSSEFRPFAATDPEKQKRYEQYLICVQHGHRNDGLVVLQGNRKMTEWEKEREKVEFERAESLYKPLTRSMASRFVTSSSTTESIERNPIEMDAQQQAASMKLFGKVTRRKEEWHPAKMLCIRFNVTPPYSDESCVGVAKRNTTDLFSSLNELEKIGDEKSRDEKSRDEMSRDKRVEEDGVDEDGEDEVIVEEKPSMDLFKSIFLDDDDDKDEEEEEEKEEETTKEISNVRREDDEPKKPTGLFANLDFDEMNKIRQSSPIRMDDSIMFGPPKPPISNKVTTKEEEEEVKKKKKKKEKKKKKKKKKSKKYKRSKRSSSSSSSSSS